MKNLKILIIILILANKINCQDLTFMTLNEYAFPEDVTNLVKSFTATLAKLKILENPVDMQSNIDQSASVREAKIGAFIKARRPILVFKQEAWLDKNKENLIKAAGDEYNHFYVPAVGAIDQFKNFFSPENLKEVEKWIQEKTATGHKLTFDDFGIINPLKLDNGLIILLRKDAQIVFKKAITYADRESDELNANKGALIIGFIDPYGNKWIAANSHLQSGTGSSTLSGDFPGAVDVREKQEAQLGNSIISSIKEHPEFKNARIIVGGDTNEPISVKNKMLYDRTGYLVRAINKAGINVSNNQVIKIVSDSVGNKEVTEIDELRKLATIKTPEGKVLRTESNNPFIKRFNDGEFEYFSKASEGYTGHQLIDHIFVEDDKTEIVSHNVLRKEFLGDKGPQAPYDPKVALSDHAAVMAVLRPKKRSNL